MSGSGISWAICKSAPRFRQITMPASHHSVFLQAGCPSCHPTNSVKALKADIVIWFNNSCALTFFLSVVIVWWWLCLSDVMIRLQEVDLELEMIGAIRNMRISPSRTVAELKIAIAAQLCVPHHDIRCVIERYYNTLKLLDAPSKTLHVEGFQKTNKVWRLSDTVSPWSFYMDTTFWKLSPCLSHIGCLILPFFLNGVNFFMRNDWSVGTRKCDWWCFAVRFLLFLTIQRA